MVGRSEAEPPGRRYEKNRKELILNFPFFIARRYLFARKSQNVINTITAISMAGIMLASFALICTLSVFNGFHELVATLFTEFDPEIKVVSNTGKVFHEGDPRIQQAVRCPVVGEYTFSLEEQALIQYKSRQQIAIVKGVETSFHDLTGMTFMRYLNDFRLEKGMERLRLTDDSVTTVALSCGFGNVRSFNRSFKERNRMTPLEYRRQFRSIAEIPGKS